MSSQESELVYPRSGFNPQTGVYSPLYQVEIPSNHDLDTATYVLSQFPEFDVAESRVALVDSATTQRVTYGQLRRSIKLLAAGLYNGLRIRKGDVVFLLSPNSVLYPTICIAVMSIGAILSTANPLNTESEIEKQVRDSGAKLGIAAPEEIHKLSRTGIPTLVTSRQADASTVSVEELIDDCEPLELPKVHITQSDNAAILYSSGTTGVSKGVILTHSNIISIMTILKWSVNVTSSDKDVFLCFLPMFHIYGLVFFGLGLFCSGVTTVVMKKFDFKAMLEAVQTYKVNNLPAVPPVILTLVKYGSCGYDLSSLRRTNTGAAPLSKELEETFRKNFPWVELRQGYGLTESCGAGSIFPSNKQAMAHSGSSGTLVPGFAVRVVDIESGNPSPPYKKGELWLKSGAVMKGYLGNETATINSDGWLQTGDLCYFDEDGCLYIVDRLKELIKHNGYQVAPAELEAILLSHPQIVDSAVIPSGFNSIQYTWMEDVPNALNPNSKVNTILGHAIHPNCVLDALGETQAGEILSPSLKQKIEDEERGQVPMAYVVRATASELTEEEVIQFVANQVAPYKKVRKAAFINAIPRSAAGKILRKDLISHSQQKVVSKM